MSIHQATKLKDEATNNIINYNNNIQVRISISLMQNTHTQRRGCHK